MRKVFPTLSVFIVAAIALLSLFVSCNGINEPESDPSYTTGKARVSFSVNNPNASQSRTIMPETFSEEHITEISIRAINLAKGENGVYQNCLSEQKNSFASIEEFKTASFELDYGTYNFTLYIYTNLTDSNGGSFAMQSDIENQVIDAGSVTLSFDKWQYLRKDSIIYTSSTYGDVSLDFSWEKDADGTNRIGAVKVGFYTIESKGIDYAKDKDGIEIEEQELSPVVDGTSVTAATVAPLHIRNGSYIVKLYLYTDENAVASDTPFNTITDIIKVNGYT